MKKMITIPLDLFKNMATRWPSEEVFALIEAAENPQITIEEFASKLERPIVFLDAETTGTNTAKDRIVSLSFIKVWPNGEVQEDSWILNPLICIPEEATAIHRISDEDVADMPTFCESLQWILDMLEDSDVAHFNGDKFDVPLLCEEFHRCGVQWPFKDTISIDVSNIFRKKESRSLEAAVQFYLQEEHAKAHDSAEDTNATMKVLFAQLKRYPDLNSLSLAELAKQTCYNPDAVDIAGKFAKNADGEFIYTFGKHSGKTCKSDPSYIDWILGADFTADTKRHAKIIQESLYQ